MLKVATEKEKSFVKRASVDTMLCFEKQDPAGYNAVRKFARIQR